MHNKLSITFLLLVLLVATGSIFTLNSLMLLLGLSSTVAAFISIITTLGLLLWSTDSVPKPWLLAFLKVLDWEKGVLTAVAVLVMTLALALSWVLALIVVVTAAKTMPGAGILIAAAAFTAAGALALAAALALALAEGLAEGLAEALAEALAAALARSLALAGAGILIAAATGALALATVSIGDTPLLTVSATVSSLALVTGLRIYKNHKQIADKNILCTLSLLIISTLLALSADALLIFALFFPSAVAFTCSYSFAVTATSLLLFAAVSFLRDLSLFLCSSHTGSLASKPLDSSYIILPVSRPQTRR